MSAEHLYELVNQSLLANFGPLGSYAITRRADSDSDDIFHTMLASSVAHNIVGNLINHSAIPLLPQPALGGSFVAATGAFAATHALPAQPLPVADLPPLRVGSHAAVDAPVVQATVPAPVAAAPTPVAAAPAPVPTPVAAAPAPAPVAAAPVPAPIAAAQAPAPVSAVSVGVPTFTAPIIPFPISAVTVPTGAPASLAPIVAVPVSADLAQALTVLDQTGPIGVTGPQPSPADPAADAASHAADRPLVSTEH